MPNWCENLFKIEGEPEKVLELISKLTGKSIGNFDELNKISDEKEIPFFFQNTFPTPLALIDTMAGNYPAGSDEEKALNELQLNNKKEYGYKNWYDWRIANWGTKWDVESAKIYDLWQYGNNALVIFEFDTAWSPPNEWLLKTSKSFPELTLTCRYEEPGIGFEGRYSACNGEVLEDISQEHIGI